MNFMQEYEVSFIVFPLNLLGQFRKEENEVSS